MKSFVDFSLNGELDLAIGEFNDQVKYLENEPGKDEDGIRFVRIFFGLISLELSSNSIPLRTFTAVMKSFLMSLY